MAGEAKRPPDADSGAKVRFAAVILIFGTTWFGPVTEAAEKLLLRHAWSWTDALLRGALYGAAMAVVFTLLLVPLGGYGARLAVRSSISARRLPSTADPVGWGPSLLRERRRLRVDRWTLPLYFAAEAGLVAGVAATSTSGSWPLWLWAAVAAVVAAVAPVRTRSRLRTVERFQIELAVPSSGGPHVGGVEDAVE